MTEFVAQPGPPGAADPSGDPLLGRAFGNFLIQKKIGEGGMGAVYLATQVTLERDVAVKILPSKLVESDAAFVERFLREARLAAKVTHPNVVQVFEAGKQEGTYYMAMEFVAGRSVASLLRDCGSLPEDKALQIARHAAQGLEAGARVNMIHRDIKPENILLTEYGLAKVADFGLAKNTAATTKITQDGAVMGTPAYMSPEQANGDPLDFRSDIYSLGATLFTLLSGRPPFLADTPLSVLYKHIHAPVPDVREANPQVSAATAELVARMMAKKPEDRFASYRDLLRALSAGKGGTGRLAPAPVEDVPFSPTPVPPARGTAPDAGDITPKTLSVEDQPTGPTLVLDAKAARRLRWIFALLGAAIPLAAGLAVVLVLALTRDAGTGRPDEDPREAAKAETGADPGPAFDLEIEKPAPGSHLAADTIEVSGRSANSDLRRVSVNGYDAETNGKGFSLRYVVERDGVLDLEVAGENAAGAKASKKIQVVVDRAPPELVLETPPEGSRTASRTARIAVAGFLRDAFPARVEVNGLEVPVGPGGRFEGEVELAAEGEAEIVAAGFDRAGNVTRKRAAVVLDTRPPAVSWDGAVESVTSGDPEIEVRVTVDEEARSVAVNGAPIEGNAGVYAARVLLREGENRIRARAEDLAGNVSEKEWKVAYRNPVLESERAEREVFDALAARAEASSSPWKKASLWKAFIADRPSSPLLQGARDRLAGIVRAALPAALPGVTLGEADGEFRNEADGAVLVWVPPGRFAMGNDGGAPEEGPRREVELSGYYVYKHEVTNAQLAVFLSALENPADADKNGWVSDCQTFLGRRFAWGVRRGDGGWEAAPGFEDHPAILVSWFGAREYAKWAKGTLPTEAQWERAARGTDGRAWPWGAAEPGPGTAVLADRKGTRPVGVTAGDRSPAGCLDMAGNVAEWCLDFFDPEFYRQRAAAGPNPVNSRAGRLNTIRGGSWFEAAEKGRTFSRRGEDPKERMPRVGFRVVRAGGNR